MTLTNGNSMNQVNPGGLSELMFCIEQILERGWLNKLTGAPRAIREERGRQPSEKLVLMSVCAHLIPGVGQPYALVRRGFFARRVAVILGGLAIHTIPTSTRGSENKIQSQI